MTKRTSAKNAAAKTTAAAKSKSTAKRAPAAKSKPAAVAAAVKPAAKSATFTSVDIANEHKMNPKTLRARIRRNIDAWSPLFADGAKHVFPDNAKTRAAVAALLNADTK